MPHVSRPKGKGRPGRGGRPAGITEAGPTTWPSPRIPTGQERRAPPAPRSPAPLPAGGPARAQNTRPKRVAHKTGMRPPASRGGCGHYGGGGRKERVLSEPGLWKARRPRGSELPALPAPPPTRLRGEARSPPAATIGDTSPPPAPGAPGPRPATTPPTPRPEAAAERREPRAGRCAAPSPAAAGSARSSRRPQGLSSSPGRRRLSGNNPFGPSRPGPQPGGRPPSPRAALTGLVSSPGDGSVTLAPGSGGQRPTRGARGAAPLKC